MALRSHSRAFVGCPSVMVECLILLSECAPCPGLCKSPSVPENIAVQDSVSLPSVALSLPPTLWLELLLGALPKFLPSAWDPGHRQCLLLGNSFWLTTVTSGDGCG